MLGVVLLCFSVAVVTTLTSSGGKDILGYISITVTVRHQWGQGRNLEAVTEAETTEEHSSLAQVV